MKQLSFFQTLDDLIDQADMAQAQKEPIKTQTKRTKEYHAHAGLNKLIAGIVRAGLNTHEKTISHIVDYFIKQGVGMDSLAEHNASDKVVDLLITAYLNRAN